MATDLVARFNEYLLALPWRDIGNFLVRNEVNAAWCGATALYFLLCLGRLLWRVVPVRRALRRVAAPLADTDKTEFADRFEAYAQSVLAEKSLAHAWREFDESLVKPTEGEQQVIRNTHDPAAYFDDATIVQAVVNTRFFDTVPSQLVGLGILGTFLGLAAGVGMASVDITSADTTKVQEALSKLLSGASLAFMTSIFGLGLSLVFLWTERRLIGSVHRRLNDWVERLARCLELVTPEQVALQQLEHARRQSKQLEQFNTDLIFALETALDDRVGKRLVPELEKVVQAIENLRVDRADSSQAAIEQLVDKFTHTLTGTAGREMTEMATTLRALGERLQGLVDALGASQQNAGDVMNEAARNLRESLAAGSGAAVAGVERALEGMVRELRKASEGFASQASAAGASMRESGQTAAENIASALGERLHGFVDALGASQQHGGDVLNEAARNLRESLAAGSGAAVAEVERALGGMVQQLRSASEGLASQASAAGTSMRESGQTAAESIASSLTSFSDGVARLERVSRAQGELAPRLEELSAGLRDAGATVLEAHRGFASSLEPTRTAVRGLESAGTRLAESLTATSKLVEEVAAAGQTMHEEQRKMAGAWQDYAVRFQGVDQSLQRAFERLVDGVAGYTDKIQEFHRELDEHVGKAMTNLASATAELHEAVEDIGARVAVRR